MYSVKSITTPKHLQHAHDIEGGLVHNLSCQSIKTPTGLTAYFQGPPLSAGMLPALFYFSLSGPESLCVDPYNQPVVALEGTPLRVFSFTLPGHGEDEDKTTAVAYWGQQLAKTPSFLKDFIDQVIETIHHLVEQGYIDPAKIAVSGLSRGAYIATQIAAHDPSIRIVLMFAPLTKPTRLEEYKQLPKAVSDLLPIDLINLVDKLQDKRIRCYIGNRDQLVGTDSCFEFLYATAEKAYQHGNRSPAVELIIGPSIGNKGHGTPPHVFQQGANWVRQELLK